MAQPIMRGRARIAAGAALMAAWLPAGAWGQSLTGGDHRDIRDAWNVSVLFIYSF